MASIALNAITCAGLVENGVKSMIHHSRSLAAIDLRSHEACGLILHGVETLI